MNQQDYLPIVTQSLSSHNAALRAARAAAHCRFDLTWAAYMGEGRNQVRSAAYRLLAAVWGDEAGIKNPSEGNAHMSKMRSVRECQAVERVANGLLAGAKTGKMINMNNLASQLLAWDRAFTDKLQQKENTVLAVATDDPLVQQLRAIQYPPQEKGHSVAPQDEKNPLSALTLSRQNSVSSSQSSESEQEDKGGLSGPPKSERAKQKPLSDAQLSIEATMAEIEGRYSDAEKILIQLAAKAGPAQKDYNYQLGMFYTAQRVADTGTNITPEISARNTELSQKAQRCFGKAADLGHNQACTEAGKYAEESGNIPLALKYYSKLGKEASTEQVFCQAIAQMQSGEGKQYAIGFAVVERLAQQNYAEAQYTLAMLERNERGSTPKSNGYFEAAAKQGYAPAQLEWGKICLGNQETAKKGAYLLELASVQGNAGASMELARIYATGVAGIEAHAGLSLQYLTDAKNQSNIVAVYNSEHIIPIIESYLASKEESIVVEGLIIAGSVASQQRIVPEWLRAKKSETYNKACALAAAGKHKLGLEELAREREEEHKGSQGEATESWGLKYLAQSVAHYKDYEQFHKGPLSEEERAAALDAKYDYTMASLQYGTEKQAETVITEGLAPLLKTLNQSSPERFGCLVDAIGERFPENKQDKSSTEKVVWAMINKLVVDRSLERN